MTHASGKYPLIRWATYKTHQHRKRAFYKWVCKQGYYRVLVNGERRPIRTLSGSNWHMDGYPRFKSGRSIARELWESKGDEILKGFIMTAEQREIKRIQDQEYERHIRICGIRKILDGYNLCPGHVETALGLIGPNECIRIPIELLEAQAFLLAIKSHLKKQKKTTHEKHNRTTK